jgi:hypothetical protein
MTEPYEVAHVPTWTASELTPDSERWSSPAREDPIDWAREGIVAGLVTIYSVLLGAVVGLIWPHVAPPFDITRAVDGSEAATKALLGADMWFALLGIVAGAVAAAILTFFGREAGRGPGGIVGLAIGGLLGSLVAAHVGHLVREPDFTSGLKAAFPGITPASVKTIQGYFGFTVRMKAVLLAWPIAAVLVHTAGIGLRAWRERSATTD